MEEFERALRDYLDKVTATDTTLAAKYQLSGKTIEGCARYIIKEMEKEAQELRQQGKTCVALAKTDAEIYGLAVHYFDEDSIKECKEQPKTKAVVAPPKPAKPEMIIVKNDETKKDILAGQLSLF